MSVYQKIQACRASIKASNLKKTGHNEYSNYDYYTPEQVNKLVYDACLSEGLFNKFSLIRNEHGLHGWLKVIDISTGESESFQAATEMPVITATNASQQMGGCMTFSERYLKQTVYDIVDNNLDFDSQDNRPHLSQKKPSSKGHTVVMDEDTKPWLNEDMPAFQKAKDAIASGGKTIKDVRKVYKVNRKVAALLETPVEDVSTVLDDPPEGLPF